VASNPIEQFELKTIAEFSVGGLDLSFTNSSYYMLVAAGLTIGLLAMAMSRPALVPGRMQSVAELTYEFVAGMIRSTAGTDGLRFFPLVFTLFAFILMANMLSMMHYFPSPGWYGFTIMSHIIITFALSMIVMSVLVVYGIWKNGMKFFSLFFPAGVPWPLYILLTPIEIISFLSRPVTLSMRLFANMLAGGILLKVFAGFVVMMGAAGGLIAVGAIAPMIMVVALTGLKFLIAFLQAYVFAVLTCIYLSDALHPGHH
jgi:F-type H+-transporting ATPase subunit a